MEQLQGTDAAFVSLETPQSPMHIGSILIYDPSTAPGGFVRFKDILAFYRSRMQLSKTMRQKLVRVPLDVDYPYWIDDEHFDLEYHLRHIALPKPGDWRQLCIQAARIFSRPLDLSRPPWEFTVVEGLDNVPGIPKGSYAVITKVHHAAIDGMSGIDLLQAVHTQTPDVSPPNTPDHWAPDRRPNQFGLFAKGYVKAWLNPVRQMGVAIRSVPGAYRTVRGMMKGDFDMSAAIRAPKTAFNTKISPHRVVEGRTFELAHVKAIRGLAEGCKVNDVLLTIVGGGMRKYLQAKDELPEATLTAMAPISVRTDDEKNSMGNQIAAMVAPLGTHIEDPAERLQYVFEQTSRSKAMTSALGARQMSEISKASPALYLALGAQLYTRLGVANIMKPVVNTVVTNVPGPPVPIYSAGSQLVSMHGLLCLFDGVALGHVVQSYVSQATIGFTACRDVMPDPEFYSQCLQDSFEEMAKAAGVKPAPVVSRKSATGRKTTAKRAATKKTGTTTRKPRATAK